MEPTPFRAVIVDDEKNSCDIIQLMLQQYCPEIKITGTADSCERGIAIIRQLHPQLIFLDLELRDGMGMDVLDKVQDENFEVIFVTAYEKKFLAVIRFSNLQIILKPADKHSLLNAVKKAEGDWLHKKSKERYNLLLENLKAEKEEYKILLCADEGYYPEALHNITWIQQLNGSTAVYLQNGNCINTIKHFHYYTELLGGFGFFQITNQIMINLAHLDQIKAGQKFIYLKDGTQLEISPRRRHELAEKIMQDKNY